MLIRQIIQLRQYSLAFTLEGGWILSPFRASNIIRDNIIRIKISNDRIIKILVKTRIMFRYILKPLIILIVTSNLVLCEPLACGSTQQPTHLTDNSTKIVINRDLEQCQFKSKDDGRFVAIKLDDLKLTEGESLVINSTKFEGPFSSGFLITGAVEPTFTLNLRKGGPSFELWYSQDPNFFSLNCDQNNKVQLISLKVKDLKVNLVKTHKKPVYLRANDVKFNDLNFGHLLTNESDAVIHFTDQESQVTELESSAVRADCSSFMISNNETSVQINGPEAPKLKSNYKCVNIYQIRNDSRQAHVEVEFKNFLGLSDQDDVLTLDDGSSMVKIDNSTADQFINATTKVFRGRNLVVLYDSPISNQPTEIQLRLTVNLRLYGGFIDVPGPLVFPVKATNVRFNIFPGALLKINDSPDIKNLTLKVFEDSGRSLGEFKRYLPPSLSANNLFTRLILGFEAPHFANMNNLFNVSSARSCNHISSDDSDGWSTLVGNRTSCVWTLSSPYKTKELTLKVSPRPVCVDIRLPDYETPIYQKCSIDPPPKFIVKQAYVTVISNSTKNSRVDGVITSSSFSPITDLKPSDQISIKSLNYPEPYPVIYQDQVYNLNVTNASYLVVIHTLDLRMGEYLKIGNRKIDNQYSSHVSGDLVILNNPIKITVYRPSIPNDFMSRRGYEINATRYDLILEADRKKNSIDWPANKSAFVKIPSPISSSSLLPFAGKRISFRIMPPLTMNDFQVHDSRTIIDKKIIVNSTSSTSDTLLLVYKPSPKTPENMNINVIYEYLNCNATDHVCDGGTRCVPLSNLCKGKFFCNDKSDLTYSCETPAPKIVETGLSGTSAFFLSLFMLTLGVIGALYGPDLYRSLESRFHSYSTFSSVE